MPISISQVWNTTLDVMKEASISPAQGLYSYWHFRKITFNYEIKKHHYLDFLTSHSHVCRHLGALQYFDQTAQEERVQTSCGQSSASRVNSTVVRIYTCIKHTAHCEHLRV